MERDRIHVNVRELSQHMSFMTVHDLLKCFPETHVFS